MSPARVLLRTQAEADRTFQHHDCRRLKPLQGREPCQLSGAAWKQPPAPHIAGQLPSCTKGQRDPGPMWAWFLGKLSVLPHPQCWKGPLFPNREWTPLAQGPPQCCHLVISLSTGHWDRSILLLLKRNTVGAAWCFVSHRMTFRLMYPTVGSHSILESLWSHALNGCGVSTTVGHCEGPGDKLLCHVSSSYVFYTNMWQWEEHRMLDSVTHWKSLSRSKG